eukprot:CAMPEP_0168182220 /NCGR_PEP_ID=MMETSP0139_2-20121125/11741_1 /TAXON_ID=44445 /ORGANISM="Pseudo-nitzschia australis, Strain 10249 10 AB" /LENGTH=88 /DNA_ID=CAMNT_0008103063 /DNA_START=35 /DNA_END=298 /DNA_ORIENTATION=+
MRRDGRKDRRTQKIREGNANVAGPNTEGAGPEEGMQEGNVAEVAGPETGMQKKSDETDERIAGPVKGMQTTAQMQPSEWLHQLQAWET